MFIVLHCGGIPFNGETIRQRSLGGSETAAYHLARELAADGHRVRVFTNDPNEGESDGVQYLHAGEPAPNAPLGVRFHAYATHTPHDVLIVQRHPLAFTHKFACKLAFLWMHDLALVRNRDMYGASMANCDGIFAVSEFHRAQVAKSLNIKDDFILPITNGVDPARFEKADAELGKMYRCNLRRAPGVQEPDLSNEFALLYSSRPERGLENLVKPGGIMAQLKEVASNAHLYICNYEHDVPEARAQYAQLFAWAKELPNVTVLGSLMQQDLAHVMKSVQLHVYPTEFEEVSCITAMECMHAALPQLVSRHAAIPETCKGAGVILVDHKDGRSDIDAFVKHIKRLASRGGDSGEYRALVERQKKCAGKYTWRNATDGVLAHIEAKFAAANDNPVTVLRHLLRTSDVQAARECMSRSNGKLPNDNPVMARILEEFKLYEFADDNAAYAEHYAAGTADFYNGPDYHGPEDCSRDARFNHVADRIADSLARRRAAAGVEGDRRLVLVDVGCAHGHHTVGLARRFPELDVVGIDVSEHAIREAKRAAEGVPNARFVQVGADVNEWRAAELKGDLVLMGEVLEHVINPWRWADNALRAVAADGAEVVFTTPVGPWEWLSYNKPDALRYHVQHFERADHFDMFGDFDHFDIITLPSQVLPNGELLGWYIGSFTWNEARVVEPVDYDRKLAEMRPMQTVTVGMIVRNAETTLRHTLAPLLPFVDELVVSIDARSSDRTREVLEQVKADFKLWPVVTVIDGPAALEVGFDAARNVTLDASHCDWYMWVDADEEVVRGNVLGKYLRPNCFNGYAIKQHHFAVEPAGILTTDLPSRLFRRDTGARFLGCVHEHPEIGDNEGIGPALLIQDIHLVHTGYLTEDVRRGRFQRNIELMLRDRKTNPKRRLGKFLWVRDLAHMCQFTLERNGGFVTEQVRGWAFEAMGTFQDLLNDGDVRLIVDTLGYYSTAVKMMGGGVEVSLRMDVQRDTQAEAMRASEVRATFADRTHAEKVLALLAKAELDKYDTKYW